MKFFFQYLWQRRKIAGAALLFCAVFAVIFALYRLPMVALLYPSGLCLLLGAFFLFRDYLMVRARHKLLNKLRSLPGAMLPPLPDPNTSDECDYQAIIASLQGELTRLSAGMDARIRDMTDYYTVWVHQIKTPIAAMRLTLGERPSDPAFRKLSLDLFHIEQYVEMVLAFLRLDSPTSDYVFRSCQVDAVIRQVLRKFALEFIDRKLTLDYHPVDLTVITDEKWLAFVLEQLLSNALKYTRPGGTVRLFLQGEKTLCVQDTGIGIVPEDLPRVFEKGYTGYNGRTNRRASGLGLYLSQRICRNLGALLTIDSSPGQGTTVQLHLDQYPLLCE